MNTDNAKGRHIENNEEFWNDGKVGDWSFCLRNGVLSEILLRTPNGTPEGNEVGLPIAERRDEPHTWQWDGNTESPTLKPSILIYTATPSPEAEWHGYMTEGELCSV